MGGFSPCSEDRDIRLVSSFALTDLDRPRQPLYVSDSGNGRVQLSQLKTTENSSSAWKVAEASLEPQSGSPEDKGTLMEH